MNEDVFLAAVKSAYARFDGSHDFTHIERVLQNAETILQTEPKANAALVRYALLLHDVSDKKYATSKAQENELIAMLQLAPHQEQQLRHIIAAISFNGGHEVATTMLEAQIARDADRLDALGAIGIARTFAFGGARGRKIYDDTEIIQTEMTEEQYRANTNSSVAHFYEKLLKLKDLMITPKGKQMAQQRHAYMEQYLQQLQKEREGLL